ncbi:MAG TPA: phosphotransferase family protein [Solirubrobacterales bacterium]|nr:phosphotransferase family protein [Solirubrobacterales bacterium]
MTGDQALGVPAATGDVGADPRTASVMAALGRARVLADGEHATGLTQLEGGWSRQAFVLATAKPDGAAREFVIRVKPPGALLDTDLRQEYEICRLLVEHGVAAPVCHEYEAEDNPFGGPFYVMDRAPGSAPNVWRKRDREALEANWAAGGSLAEDLLDSLVRIHGVPAEPVAAVLPRRDFDAAVSHWEEVQGSMALVRDPVVEDAYAWLRERMPDPIEPTLVHGDYRIGNCLSEDGRVTAILDWEIAYLGDPRYDLGYISLEYEAGRFTRPGSPLLGSVADREWFFDQYEARSGRPVDREVVRTYAVLADLMLTAILTTGIRMYVDGRSTDVRMVWTRFALAALRQELTELMRY